ncbi:MAG: transposase [Deltaproteobacteria bacterium]|nr:transposase [Deltaproteobacteria bacterium]
MAVDARLIRSASRPVSGKKLKELRGKRKNESGQKDKNGLPLKFQRDVDSDWTVKNGKPIFRMKEHASLDVKSGLVLSSLMSRASEHDTNYFQAAVGKGIHGDNLPPKVYADKGCCGQSNRSFLSINGIGDGIMRKDQIKTKLTPLEIERNRMISKVRYKIEQYFGLSHLHQRGGTAKIHHPGQGGLGPALWGYGLQHQASCSGNRKKGGSCHRIR